MGRRADPPFMKKETHDSTTNLVNENFMLNDGDCTQIKSKDARNFYVMDTP